MDALPPNDPNQNNNDGNNRHVAKPDPMGGANRRDGNTEMDIIGNLQDQPMVVIMFLMGVASWLLKEQCTC
jgi:hypothetical protein